MELIFEPLDGLKAEPGDTIFVDHKYRVITAILETTVTTDAGLLAAFANVRGMSEFTEGYSVVVDAGHASESRVTGDGIFNLAQASHDDKNTFAIVVGNGRSLGMAKMYEACANWKSNRVAVFTSTQAALASLGISDYLRPTQP
jgi:hypothetical protein